MHLIKIRYNSINNLANIERSITFWGRLISNKEKRGNNVYTHLDK